MYLSYILISSLLYILSSSLYIKITQNDKTKLNACSDVLGYVENCVHDLLNTTCMSSIGAPLDPNVVFGGFNLTEKDYGNATALVLTFLLNNVPGKSYD